MKAVDLGCGAGRHTKLLLEHGFTTKAIDIDPDNIRDTKALNGDNKRLSCEVADFSEWKTREAFDIAIAWNFFYGYNKTRDEIVSRVKRTHEILSPGGKVVASFRTDRDGMKRFSVMEDKGVFKNSLYKTPGCVFLSKEEMINVFDRTDFDIDYYEIYSRTHTMNWKSVNGNGSWEREDLNVYEEWFAVAATKR